MNTKTETTPRLPRLNEYVRGQGTLVECEEVAPPPPPPTHDFIFEEITAHCELRHDGEVIKSFNSVWDFYGKGKSVEDAIACAKEYAAKKKLGPNSEMEVVAIETRERFRKRPKGEKKNFYAEEFLDFEPLEIGRSRGMPPAKLKVVWNSKKP